MNIGFTGTRRGMSLEQRAAVRALLNKIRPESLHHGDAIGADAEAHAIAAELGITIVVHPGPAENQRAFTTGGEVRLPAAYMVRNRAIVDETDALIAVPIDLETEASRSGTWRTVRYARRTGKLVHVIWPDGTLTGG